jgi:hypothetical protein
MAKVMKKRVVKVALHRVKGIDATGQAAYPRLCPDAATLAAKLNAIYEPQINTTFEVTPFDEAGGDGAGIDFDTNNDGDLLVNNDVERWNATPHSKLSLGLAHIDIWLVGGAKLMSLDQASVKVKVMGATTSEKSILIDGDFPDMSWAVPPEREIDVLCNTMAHEIGHVMGLDGHPSEPGYEFSLRFENGRDPFLTKRLMCPGDKANLRNLGTCLIKREWDKFEEWLYANVDT